MNEPIRVGGGFWTCAGCGEVFHASDGHTPHGQECCATLTYVGRAGAPAPAPQRGEPGERLREAAEAAAAYLKGVLSTREHALTGKQVLADLRAALSAPAPGAPRVTGAQIDGLFKMISTNTHRDWCEAMAAGVNALLSAGVCPHVRQSAEGTAYCSLAESGGAPEGVTVTGEVRAAHHEAVNACPHVVEGEVVCRACSDAALDALTQRLTQGERARATQQQEGEK